MPRDVNGAYSLPDGNPVQSGEPIESGWANTTMLDIATELTNSLDRYGRGGMLAPFKFADGTVSAPSITFANETSTGFWRAGSIGSGDLRATVLGVDLMRLWNGKVYFSVGGVWTEAVSLKLANNTFLTSVTTGNVPKNLIGLASTDAVSVGDSSTPLFLNANTPPTWWDGTTSHILAATNVNQTWSAPQTLLNNVPLRALNTLGTAYNLLLVTTGNALEVGSSNFQTMIRSASSPYWNDPSTNTNYLLAYTNAQNIFTAQQVLHHAIPLYCRHGDLASLRSAVLFSGLTLYLGDALSPTVIRSSDRPVWAWNGGSAPIALTTDPPPLGLASAGGRWLVTGPTTQQDGWGGIKIWEGSTNRWVVQWSNPSNKTPVILAQIISPDNADRSNTAVVEMVSNAQCQIRILNADNYAQHCSFHVAIFLY